MYCKHCGTSLSSSTRSHHCKKAGLLNVDKGDSFLVSSLIGYATGSTIIGGLLGGSIGGALLGDFLDGGSIMDDDDW